MTELLSYASSDGVATIAMDDGKANVLSIAMLAELRAALDQAAADDAVVVLAGRDGIFSGGFHLPTIRARDADSAKMLRSGFDLAMQILTFPAPMVVACTGHAVAQAAILLLCADDRIGADGPYKITMNEVAIGLTMFRTMIEIGRSRLHPAHLHRSMVLAEVYSPARAVEAGFLDRVVPPDEVFGAAQAAARAYVALDRQAHAATKARVREELVPRVKALIEREMPG